MTELNDAKIPSTSATLVSGQNEVTTVTTNHDSSEPNKVNEVSINFPTRKQGINIASHNINRLISQSNTKLDQLHHFLESDKPPVDVYGICETFLSQIDNDYVSIKCFQTIRKDREYSRGWGSHYIHQIWS